MGLMDTLRRAFGTEDPSVKLTIVDAADRKQKLRVADEQQAKQLLAQGLAKTEDFALYFEDALGNHFDVSREVKMSDEYLIGLTRADAPDVSLGLFVSLDNTALIERALEAFMRGDVAMSFVKWDPYLTMDYTAP